VIRALLLVAASIALAVAAAFRWDAPEQGFAMRAVMMGALLAGLLPFIAAWHGQEHRSGTPLLDLGRPDRAAPGGLNALFALYGLQSIIAAVSRTATGPARVAGWLGALVFSAAIHWSVVAWRRGLSLRDGGVLTPYDLIAWDEIFFWSCHRDHGTLVLGLRGAGWMRALMTGKPASDTMQSWRVPADRIDAVEAILAQRARQLR
jgi:hypothetical protein